MVEQNLDQPKPLGNRQCDAAGCEQPAAWMLRTDRPVVVGTEVQFLCEIHLLEQLARTVAWQRSFHAVLLKEEPAATILPRIKRLDVIVSKTRNGTADLLTVISDDAVTVNFSRIADGVVIRDMRQDDKDRSDPGVAWG